MSESLLTSSALTFTAKAVLLGERLDLRALGATSRTGSAPLVIETRGGGLAVLFRYGAAVLYDLTTLDEDEFIRQIMPRVLQPFSDTERETETVSVRIDSQARDAMESSTVILTDKSNERLQLVADVLSKSVALAKHENTVAQQFDRIEPFAANVDHWGRGTIAAKELLQHLGGALLSEHRIVGGVQPDDKPELLWDHPELERLWLRLRDEFEIRERFDALHRKLALITRTAETALELLQNRRALRVEWYIVALIVFEICLTLAQMVVFGRGRI